MKKLLGVFTVTTMMFASISASANEDILSQLSFVGCQGRNSSIAINLEKKVVTRERFSADTHAIKNIRLDQSKNQISFEEVTPHGDIEYKLQVMSGVFGEGLVSVDLILGENTLAQCQGFLKK